MHNWFECKVSFEKIMENGAQKKVTEPYLVDALSFTEAEARIIEEIRPFVSGEFTVTDIKRARLSELFFNENGDRFYKIKVYFITLDEKSGAEKKTAAQMLAQASNLKDAIAVLEDGMKGTLADYTIASVTETQLMDVFPFDANSVPAEKKSEEELIAEQKKQAETNRKIEKCEVGAVMNGTVETIKPYGAFVALENGLTGLLHISQISTQRIKHPGAVLKEGQEVRVKILSTADNKISLSMKVLAEEAAEAESHSTYDYKEEGQASTGLAALLKNIKL